MTAFAAHMQALAQEFIGTVLFVDDQIGEIPAPVNKIEDNSITTTSEENYPLKNAFSDAEIMKAPNDLSSTEVETTSKDDSHALKIRRLSLAFSAKNILCSPIYTDPILTEEQQTDFVTKVCRLANKADVVVLDWQMEAITGSVKMGTTARQIIDRYKSENRDRDILVCIFTAETKDKVDVDKLSRDNVKVFHVWKKETYSYEDLPGKLFGEFAKRHEGLLPSAALSAIKVIRDNTHRILSLYSSEHDSAYLSHRCLLPRPEDAEVFATELMAATFEDLMRGNEAITKNLSFDILKLWVDSKCNGIEEKSISVKKCELATINNPERQHWLESGIVQWMHRNLKANIGVDNTKKTSEIESWERRTAKGVAEYFIKDGTITDEFSRQSSFAKLTSHAFADAINNNASTFLSLGSVLKHGLNDYYLCIQPLCDSVRLKPGKKFLLLKLERKIFDVADNNTKSFHLIVNDGDNGDVYLKVSEEVSAVEVYWFSASAGNDKVILKIGEPVTGKINETTEIEFKFLAQLRASKAQKIAMNFLHQITRVGFDESEWLRRHSTP
jgi:CheY-like chemotaxis protein